MCSYINVTTATKTLRFLDSYPRKRNKSKHVHALKKTANVTGMEELPQQWAHMLFLSQLQVVGPSEIL